MPTSPHNDNSTVRWDRLRRRRLVEAEVYLRLAGRVLQLVAASDIEADRMARLAFRLASRVRTDRLVTA